MEFEFIVEIVNAALGVAAIVYAVGVMHSVKGGMLEGVWKYIGIAGFFFGVMEIIGLLDALKIFESSPVDLEVVRELVEFVTIATLVAALVKAKKIFRI